MSIEVFLKEGYLEALARVQLGKLYPGCQMEFKREKIILDNIPDDASSDDVRLALEEGAKVQVGKIKMNY